MVERQRTLRQALGATMQGDRPMAIQLYTLMLMKDRTDPDAIEGLRRLRCPVPFVDAREPGKAPEPAGPSSKVGPPPLEVVDNRPGGRQSAGNNNSHSNSRRSAYIVLMIAGLLILAGLLSAWTAKRALANRGGAAVEPPTCPESTPVTALLMKAGEIEETPNGRKWQITARYPQSELAQAAFGEEILQADPALQGARVGGIEATRRTDSIEMVGADKTRLGLERRMVLISAVWRYAEAKGKYPKTVQELVPEFLDRIPAEPISGRSREVPVEDGLGGWAYSPPKQTDDLWRAIGNAVRPNTPSGSTATPERITPLTVQVSKSGRTLDVLSGSNRVRRYSVGIGADNMTPEGTFRIDKRAVLDGKLPDGSPNPFGTRWLRLTVQGEAGAYGIHGTVRPEDVGQPLSKGCLVLSPGDLEDLYELVPVGTPVTIMP